MLATANPFPLYNDASGLPLQAGYVYFGTANANPETSPVTVYWDLAGTQPAAQPLRTLNGYIVRNGTPALVYAAADYSLTVRSNTGALIFNASNSASFSNDFTLNALIVATDAAMRADLANQVLNTKGGGLVGFGPGLAYPITTVGGRVNKAGHPSATNTIIGIGAYDDHLLAGTVGYRTTAFGVQALQNNGSSVSAGGSNSAFGFGALAANIDGSGNNAFGALALNALTGLTASHCNAFGYRVLAASIAGVQNNGFGFQVLNSLVTGDDNCGFGESVLTTTTNSTACTGMGFNCLFSKTSGNFSVAYGSQACFSETTAVGNTGIGKDALYNFTTQGGNTAVGYEAGRGVAGGINNSFFGYQVGTAINGGTYNTGVGFQSLLRLTTGGSNTALGQQSGNFITTGSSNICIGDSAGFGVVTTSSNVAVGSSTLTNLDGGFNTAIGYNAGSPVAAQTWTNTTALGNGALPTGSNQVTLGNASIATIRAQVTTITAISDARDKANRVAFGFGLDLINAIEINAWTWDQRRGSDRNGSRDFGVIAQQLLEVQEKFGAQWLQLVDTTDPEHLEATPGKLLYPLIVAVQELSAQVDDLRRAA